jgi:hypothetical protein
MIVYGVILLTLAWPLGALTMLLTAAAYVIGIGVGAAWEDETAELD